MIIGYISLILIWIFFINYWIGYLIWKKYRNENKFLRELLTKQLNILPVIKSLPEPDEIRMKARELDEKDFAQWMYELQKGNVL